MSLKETHVDPKKGRQERSHYILLIHLSLDFKEERYGK